MDIRLDPRATLSIGKNVRINSGSLNNPVGGHRRTVIGAGKGATITIGAQTGISSSTIVAMRYIRIGSSVLIGGDCCIYDSDFHALHSTDRKHGQVGLVKTAPVEIGDHAFLGTRCTILKNSTIGPAAVIGASSLIAGKVPENELWAGVPARHIRHLAVDV